ncbi:Uncharacterized protein YR821_2898 [Yersinia ruckeri]|uniref:Uncharacterized protein n=1 Tax=Yersinia ruckeri TaxID=29486 RepID=A0A0A8VLB9_YERRU|nr:hypothetical protein yruck0001_32940 [Yersinia ruckeri ATCC 29473]QTD77815.1 Uncharacterized protein YR821_2898 [Yersinia ruckeri]CEK28739.1 hypothetical protein CSF007_15080 [Yersinia ruckeri]
MNDNFLIVQGVPQASQNGLFLPVTVTPWLNFVTQTRAIP